VPLVDEVEQWLNSSTMSRRERKKRYAGEGCQWRAVESIDFNQNSEAPQTR
jgi:hypothetical protein